MSSFQAVGSLTPSKTIPFKWTVVSIKVWHGLEVSLGTVPVA